MPLKERFENEVVPSLMKGWDLPSPLMVPRPIKVVVNMGVGAAKDDDSLLEEAQRELSLISGQKPNVRRARKSESGWAIRAGDPIGLAVTLRRERMWSFLDRLIRVALPRVRDFRGLSRKSFDGQGNYTVGISDHTVFPEINPDEVTRAKGFEVTVVTNTTDDDKAFEVLRALGMPFKEEKSEARNPKHETNPKFQ